MLLSAALSFLGGSAFRFLIGQATDWLQKRQAHLQELDLIREQEKIDAAKHARQIEMVGLQAHLKVEEIRTADEGRVSVAEAQAFVEAQKIANTPTGVKWIDGWNGGIRPAAATISILIWMLDVMKVSLTITEWDKNLIASILGYYFADRHIGKPRK